MKKILKINFHRCFSTSLPVNKINPIFFFYRILSLENKLNQILLPYYNMNNYYNVKVASFYDDDETVLHNDIISNFQISDFDLYIKALADIINEKVFDLYPEGTKMNNVMIKIYIDKINIEVNSSHTNGNKIPNGKRDFSTLLPVNNSQKFFIYKHDILYLESKLEEILALYYHDDYTYKLLIYYDNSILLDDSYLMKDFIPDFDEYIKTLAKLIFERVAEEVPNDNTIITICVSGEEKTDKGLKHFIDSLLNDAYTKPASKRHFSTNMDNTSAASETKAKDMVKSNKGKGYTKPSDLYHEDGIEYGRNFGKWKCLNCENIWTSAYTWISTDFCLNNKLRFKDKNGEWWYNGNKLRSKDFILEECKECTSNSNVKIMSYHKLKFNENEINSPHVASLCAKCKKGHPCQDAWKN